MSWAVQQFSSSCYYVYRAFSLVLAFVLCTSERCTGTWAQCCGSSAHQSPGLYHSTMQWWMIWVVQHINHQLMICFDHVNSSHMQQVSVHQAPSCACIDVPHTSALYLFPVHISHRFVSLVRWSKLSAAYLTIKWSSSIVLALLLCTSESCTGSGHKVYLYKPLRCLSWQMSKESCSWYDELHWSRMQLSRRPAAEMTSWRGDDRLHLSCSQLSWQSSWQVGLTQQVNKWQLSWQIAPQLTYHSQADTLQPNIWITVNLLKHSGADKVQPGRSSETKEKADSSSNMLSWYDKLVWTNRVQLSWQCAAELTNCMWANLLQLSLQIAAERSWRIAAEASWYIPFLGMTCEQLKHVICSSACRFSCNVGCRLPITLLPICCCPQSAQLRQLPGDYKNKLRICSQKQADNLS